MFTMSSIICATDLSEDSNKALPLAAYLAHKHQAKLIVVHVIDLPAVTPYGETMVDPQELRERVEQSAKVQVAEIMNTCGDQVEWELNISIGYPAKEIKNVVAESDAGLVVAATHIRNDLERLLLGSVTRKLMHTLDVPFLIVPGALTADRSCLKKVESILIACDFSPDSANAIRWGIDFAQSFDAKLTLAYVIEPSQLNQLLSIDPHKKHDLPSKLQQEQHQKLLEAIPSEDREQCQPETVVLAGKPHEEINKYAILNHVDMIVMGVHGRGFIENLLVGSTTDRLVRMGQFPVMAVRSSTTIGHSRKEKKEA